MGVLLHAAQTILTDTDTISRTDISKPHSFSDSFNEYFLSPSFTPGTTLGTRNISKDKMDKGPCHHGAYISARETDNKQRTCK